MRLLFQFGMILLALPLMAQSNAGELRVKVVDPNGLAVKAGITLSSSAPELHRSLLTDGTGYVSARNLPFGSYQLIVESEGSLRFAGLVEIRSVLPTEYVVKLSIAAMSTAVDVRCGKSFA